MTFRLLLASSSPYRAELLARLKLPFDQASPDIDEAPLGEEAPETYVKRLASEKAEALRAEYPRHWIIGSDQTCVVDNTPVGKPGSESRALEQLERVQGRSITFLTALCLLAPDGKRYELTEPFTVNFRSLPTDVLRQYIEIEQPLDCAGSFKVEGLGINLFSSMDGRDMNALIGLPLIGLCDLLREAGLEPLRLAEA